MTTHWNIDPDLSPKQTQVVARQYIREALDELGEFLSDCPDDREIATRRGRAVWEFCQDFRSIVLGIAPHQDNPPLLELIEDTADLGRERMG